MKRYVGTGEAAKALGVKPLTMHRWAQTGQLVPDFLTSGGRRRYDLSRILPFDENASVVKKRTIGYARVSSRDQKKDLKTQADLLQAYCAAKGWECDVITDVGSGLNYNKVGLDALLKRILSGEVERLVITHKDRVLRFGAELIFKVCEAKGVEVVVLNEAVDASAEESLARDVLEIITVFSARLHGQRSRKNKQMLDRIREAVGSPDE